MIRLVPAKCPSCGANLELDDNLKRTECEFCKTTIVVDEAIEKYQVEVKGTVKVSGIKGEAEKLEIIKKYLKIEEYNKAMDKLEKFIEEYPFNLEAIKLMIEILTFHGINNRKDNIYPRISRNRANLELYLNRLAKLDDENKYSDFINNIKSEREEAEKKAEESIKKMNEQYAKTENAKRELREKIDQYLAIGNKKNKYIKFIITLLNSLKIDTSKYGKNMCLVDFHIEFHENYPGTRYYPKPYLVDISEDSIKIGGIIFDHTYLDGYFKNGCVGEEHLYQKFYKKDEVELADQNKFGNHARFYDTIHLKRVERITYEEQIKIVDNLLDDANKSIFDKLFNK